MWARECKVVEDEETQQVMKAARLFPRRLPVELYSTGRRLFRFRIEVLKYFSNAITGFTRTRVDNRRVREYVEIQGWQEESC